MPFWFASRTEEQTILRSFCRHEEKDEEDDFRPPQDSIEVAPMNGSRFNVEEEPGSQSYIDYIHVGTEETLIPSNVDEYVI